MRNRHATEVSRIRYAFLLLSTTQLSKKCCQKYLLYFLYNNISKRLAFFQ